MAPALVTAAAIKDRVLFPAMDARALNTKQDRLLHNPETPEPDSVLELLGSAEKAGRLAASSLRELAHLTQALRASNEAEGAEEMAIAGIADELATDLRRIELSGNGRRAITAKSIARRLRAPLSLLAQSAAVDAAQLLEACRVITAAIDQVPALQLLGPAVRHELGDERYRLLERLIQSRQTNGAASLVATGTAARASSHDRA